MLCTVVKVQIWVTVVILVHCSDDRGKSYFCSNVQQQVILVLDAFHNHRLEKKYKIILNKNKQK